MARIRTIKPEFPQSESMGRVSREARLAFVLSWTLADDSGRLRGNSRMLASLLFPYDDDAPALIDGWLDELASEGCIDRYLVDGQAYIEIRNWLNHQKIDKPSASKIISFAEASRALANPREESSEDQGRDQGRDQGEDAPKAAPARKRAAPLPVDFQITPDIRAWAKPLGFEPLLDKHLDYFRDYCAAYRKLYVDHEAAFRNCVKADWGGIRKTANGFQKPAGPKAASHADAAPVLAESRAAVKTPMPDALRGQIRRNA